MVFCFVCLFFYSEGSEAVERVAQRCGKFLIPEDEIMKFKVKALSNLI